MNLNKLVFFNTGWMKEYKGLDDDQLIGGGAFVKQNGYGGEINNFNCCKDGYVYGFVEPGLQRDGRSQKKINIKQLGAGKADDHIDDITVVWTAVRPQGGTCIVGWYFHATVFRESISDPSLGRYHPERDYQGVTQLYNVKTKDFVWLPEGERNFGVPRGKGYFGQSNIWYADAVESQEFVEKVKDYIRRETDARRQ